VVDYLNIIMILSTTVLCVVLPIITGEFVIWSSVVLRAAVILIAVHPITTAGHYCLISGRGRGHYLDVKGDYPYLTGEEAISFIMSMALALAVAVWTYMSFEPDAFSLPSVAARAQVKRSFGSIELNEFDVCIS